MGVSSGGAGASNQGQAMSNAYRSERAGAGSSFMQRTQGTGFGGAHNPYQQQNSDEYTGMNDRFERLDVN